MRGGDIFVLVGLAAVLLWAATALDEGGKTDDVGTAIIVTALIVGALAFGYVRRRWSAVAWASLAYVAYVVVEHVRWEDDPRLSGIDDLDPLIGLIGTPFVALVPALGVWLGKSIATNGARRGIARVVGALVAASILSAMLISSWYGIVALTGKSGDCTRRGECSALAEFTYDSGLLVPIICVAIAALVVRFLVGRRRAPADPPPARA